MASMAGWRGLSRETPWGQEPPPPSQPSHVQNKMCVIRMTRSQERWSSAWWRSLGGRGRGLLPLSHQEPRCGCPGVT